MKAIYEGVLMGLFLSVFIGPVFFLLIDTSIKKGVAKAFIMDAGVLLSDILWIILLYWGIDKYLGTFLESPKAMIFAGAIFILFGISSLFSLKQKRVRLREKKKGKLFIEGFLLNSVNPSVALFWLATIGYSLKEFENDKAQLLIFFSSIFISIILIDVLKFVMASKLSHFLNEKRQHQFSMITSLILILFGLYMIFSNGL